MTTIPDAWIDAINAAGLTLDMIEVDPHDALIDAARQHEIPEADLDRFLHWAEDYSA